MIIGLILSVVFGLLNAVMGLIPTFAAFNPDYYGYGGVAILIGQFLGLLDLFLPIQLMFDCLLGIFAARAFVAVVQFIRWVWDVIPFKSS